MKVYKPKEEFVQSINIQNVYVELLKDYHKNLTTEIEIETSSKSALGVTYRLSKLKVEFYELGAKLDEQIDLLRNKILHYDTNFITSYDLELAECVDEFDDLLVNYSKILEANFKVWKTAIKTDKLSNIATLEDKNTFKELKVVRITQGKLSYQSKIKKIKFFIEDWKSLDLKDRNHIEVKNVLYKDIKKLVTFTQI